MGLWQRLFGSGAKPQTLFGGRPAPATEPKPSQARPVAAQSQPSSARPIPVGVQYAEGAPSAPTDAQVDAFEAAVRGGRWKEAEALLRKAPCLANKEAFKDIFGTYLHWAAAEGKAEFAELLLAHGAEVSARNVFGASPLSNALFWKHLDIVKLLVGHGCDFFDAVELGDEEMVERLLKGNRELALQAIEHGETALHLAARRGHNQIADLLLKYGADVNAKGPEGQTPLFYAIDQYETARLLISRGAKLNERRATGGTFLDMAVSIGRTELVKMLLESGAQVNTGRDGGRSALDEAAANGHDEIVNLLKAFGAEGEIVKDYIECPPYEGHACCSDDQCPCDETSMPPASGFLYIDPQVIEFRRDCLTMQALKEKIERLSQKVGAPIFGGKNMFAPIVVCEQAARLRNLSLRIASSDFEMWMTRGVVPFRATPGAGEDGRAQEA